MALNWKSFLQIPETIREEYAENSRKKNQISFPVISLIILSVELFNIARVLFLSRSGLGTLNNQIYFTFYLGFLISAAAALGLQQHWKKAKKRLTGLYAGMVMFWMLLNVLLNTYDLRKNPEGGSLIYITAVIGFTFFLQFHPVYTAFYLLLGYALFLILNAAALGGGDIINVSITILVVLSVTFTRFGHVRRDLLQQKLIMNMNRSMVKEHEKLRLSLEKHKIMMEQANEIMFDWSFEKDIITFSRNWNKEFGFPEQIPEFMKWLKSVDRVIEQDRHTLLSMAEECKNGRPYAQCECFLETVKGSWEWFLVRASVQFDRNGTPIECFGILNNINKQKTEIAQLQSLLKCDSLTGILNKAAVRSYAETLLPHVSAHEKAVMFIIDLDNFKHINDTYGHPYGDAVLIRIAGTLQRIFRENDGLGRIGGDEFAVLLSGIKDITTVEKKAAYLLSEISALEWDKEQLKICCSIGAAVTEDPGLSYEQLYSQADTALYEAKKRGRNCFFIHPPTP